MTLTVPRAELKAALKYMGRFVKKLEGAEAALTFREGYLQIALAADFVQVRAEGEWNGEVRIDGSTLARLARVLPAADPVELRVADGKLSISGFKIPCKHMSASRPTPVRELLPPDDDLFDILLLKSRCSREEFEAAGAAPLIADAERRLNAVCAQAAAGLRRYRVTAEDVEALCARHLEEGTRTFRACEITTIRQVAAAWVILAPLGVEPAEIKQLMERGLRGAWR